MAGFTKLHNSIIYSSIWEEDAYTRLLWITMLAMANSKGEVIVAPKRLCVIANIPAEKCEKSLSKLSSPDADSRTPDNEGRRIAKIQGGWIILNYLKYRAVQGEETRRKQNREAKRRERERKSGVVSDVSNSQHDTKKQDADVSTVSISTLSAEAEAEAEAVKKTARASLIEEFDKEFWPHVPKKIGTGKARQAYIKARKKASKEVILAGLPKFRKYEQGRSTQSDYRPLHPATWLNQERWDDDEVKEAKHGRTQKYDRDFDGTTSQIGTVVDV